MYSCFRVVVCLTHTHVTPVAPATFLPLPTLLGRGKKAGENRQTSPFI